jgi:hypothetical protein
MQGGSKSFWKSLGVGVLGLLSFMLLVFFVAMFFSGARHMSVASKPTVSSGTSTIMKGEPMNVALPKGNKAKRTSPLILEGNSSMPMMDAAAPGVMMEGRVGGAMMNVEQKVMKNASLTLQVENADQATAKVRTIAEELGGTVMNSFFDQSTGSVKTGSVTISVPVTQFEEALSRLKGVATQVVSENTSGSDVTEQWIDLQARLTNKKAAEAALQNLLDKAEKVSDIIEITDKLTAVRSEIESLDGQMRYLNSQTDRASITVFMTEDQTITTDQGFRPGQTFKESVVMLFKTLGHFLEGIIMLAILGLPMVIVYGLIIYIVYRLTHKFVSRFWHGVTTEKKRVVRRKVN